MRAYARLMCKSWSCVVCAPKKAYRLRKAIEEWAGTHGLTRFLTLTLDPRNIPEDVPKEKHLKKSWAKFRVYAKRELKERLEYIAVMEYHKSGIPHLHALVNQYIPQPWLVGAWSSVGGGKIVHIQRLDNRDRIAGYLAKYMSKDIILSAPKRARRYMTSRGIKLFKRYIHTGQLELLEHDKPSGWELMERPIEEYYVGAGREIVTEEMGEDGRIRLFVTPEAVKRFGP